MHAAAPTVARYCPHCGATAAAELCPDDHTPTVVLARFTKQPRNYQPGDVVGGRYRITEPLGAGGFAAVFAAEHLGTRQSVALKLLALDPMAVGELAIRRFFREARVTAALQHANNVRVFDVGQDGGGPMFMVMERIRGRTLTQVLRERIAQGGTLSEAETVEVALQTLDALAEAHGNGLVHRDLKPANLMVLDEPPLRVKVLDYGIARTADSSLTAAGTMPGTPAFVSPEQVQGRLVDGRSDLYALGVVMYACVTAGRVPFEHQDPMQVMWMHTASPVPDPRSVAPAPLSQVFVDVVLRALAKDPAARWRDAADMQAGLRRAQRQPSGVTVLDVAVGPRITGPAVEPRPVAVPSPAQQGPGAAEAQVHAHPEPAAARMASPPQIPRRAHAGSESAAMRAYAAAPPWLLALLAVGVACGVAATVLLWGPRDPAATSPQPGGGRGPAGGGARAAAAPVALPATSPTAHPTTTPPAPPAPHAGPVPLAPGVPTASAPPEPAVEPGAPTGKDAPASIPGGTARRRAARLPAAFPAPDRRPSALGPALMD